MKSKSIEYVSDVCDGKSEEWKKVAYCVVQLAYRDRKEKQREHKLK